MKYRVKERASGSYNDALLGPVEFSFKAGEVEPQSEQDEVALRYLCELNLAELSPKKPHKEES